MHILHVGKYYPPHNGGIEKFMAYLFKSICSDDLQITSIIFNNYKNSKIEHTLKNLNLIEVPCYGELFHTPVSLTFKMKLDAAIEYVNPDIIHIHMPNTSAFWILLNSNAKNIPWVIHWHSDVIFNGLFKTLAYKVYKLFEFRLLKKSKLIIATSQSYLSTSQVLQRWKYKCKVLPLGIDMSSHCIGEVDKNILNLKYDCNDYFKVLCVGRCSIYKGHDVLIQAISRLENTRLFLVTNSIDRSLTDCIQKYNVNNRVTILINITDTHIRELYNYCDCFCFPSTNRAEAFGMVLLEAMLYSLPIIASKIDGTAIPELIKDGETGLLSTPGSAKEIYDKLTYLRANKIAAIQMTLRSKEIVLSNYDIAKISCALKAIYYSIINREI